MVKGWRERVVVFAVCCETKRKDPNDQALALWPNWRGGDREKALRATADKAFWLFWGKMNFPHFGTSDARGTLADSSTKSERDVMVEGESLLTHLLFVHKSQLGGVGRQGLPKSESRYDSETFPTKNKIRSWESIICLMSLLPLWMTTIKTQFIGKGGVPIIVMRTLLLTIKIQLCPKERVNHCVDEDPHGQEVSHCPVNNQSARSHC